MESPLQLSSLISLLFAATLSLAMDDDMTRAPPVPDTDFLYNNDTNTFNRPTPALIISADSDPELQDPNNTPGRHPPLTIYYCIDSDLHRGFFNIDIDHQGGCFSAHVTRKDIKRARIEEGTTCEFFFKSNACAGTWLICQVVVAEVSSPQLDAELC